MCTLTTDTTLVLCLRRHSWSFLIVTLAPKRQLNLDDADGGVGLR